MSAMASGQTAYSIFVSTRLFGNVFMYIPYKLSYMYMLLVFKCCMSIYVLLVSIDVILVLILHLFDDKKNRKLLKEMEII